MQILQKCIVCSYHILLKFYLHSPAFSNLFLANKFMLTLSLSQVVHEKSFSNLILFQQL